MIICKFGEKVKFQKRKDLVLGAFDSFHKGHQKLLECLTDVCRTFVSLFDPLPSIFFQENFPGAVCSFRQRCEFLCCFGISGVLLVDFSYELSRICGGDFLETICRCIPVRRVIVGADFCAGRDRLFCADSLRSWGNFSGIDVVIVQLHGCCGSKFSSRAVREAVLVGDFDKVFEAMGRPYSLDLRGLGFRSVSGGFVICLENTEQVVPCDGMYRITGGGVVVLKNKKLFTTEFSLLGKSCFFEKKIG